MIIVAGREVGGDLGAFGLADLTQLGQVRPDRCGIVVAVVGRASGLLGGGRGRGLAEARVHSVDDGGGDAVAALAQLLAEPGGFDQCVSLG